MGQRRASNIVIVAGEAEEDPGTARGDDGGRGVVRSSQSGSGLRRVVAFVVETPQLKVDLAQRAAGHQLLALRLRPLDKDDFGRSDRFARPTFGFLDDGKEALVSVALPLLDGPTDGLNPSALAHVLRKVQRQGVDAYGGQRDVDQVARVVQHRQRVDLLLHDARLQQTDIDVWDLDGAAQLEQSGIFVESRAGFFLFQQSRPLFLQRVLRFHVFDATPVHSSTLVIGWRFSTVGTNDSTRPNPDSVGNT